MAVIAFLIVTALALYAGVFVGTLAYRYADYLQGIRPDPEDERRKALDQHYARTLRRKAA